MNQIYLVILGFSTSEGAAIAAFSTKDKAIGYCNNYENGSFVNLGFGDVWADKNNIRTLEIKLMEVM